MSQSPGWFGFVYPAGSSVTSCTQCAHFPREERAAMAQHTALESKYKDGSCQLLCNVFCVCVDILCPIIRIAMVVVVIVVYS